MQFVETKNWSSRWPRELKFLCLRFRIEDLGKIVQMTGLCSAWWYSNTISMANTFPK